MEDLDYSLFMQSLVQSSNKTALKYFHHDIKAEYKEDASPVTIADKIIESDLREKIARQFPSHDIIGEEFDNKNNDSEYCWVIDPIDGTKNFTAGIPCFATLIALCRDGSPIIGCISAPAMNKIWIGGKKIPARCNGVPIKTRACPDLKESWLSYTSPSMFDPSLFKKIQLIEQQTKISIYGNDAIAFALVAEGRLDLVIENDLKPWDFCALAPIIEAAGGVACDFNGDGITLKSDGSFIGAANQKLYHQISDILKSE